MIYHNPYKQPQTGFALLLSLIVVSVLVSVGLTVLDLSMKQIRLSTNSKESEIAFHAANAGLECARWWRLDKAVDVEGGANTSMSCFDISASAVAPQNPDPTFTGSGDANVYQAEFTWGPVTAPRCSRMTTLVIVSDQSGTTTVSDMETLMPGYPYGDTKDCEPGGLCTIISAQGYSRSCGRINDIGTIQREVLLEL